MDFQYTPASFQILSEYTVLMVLRDNKHAISGSFAERFFGLCWDKEGMRKTNGADLGEPRCKSLGIWGEWSWLEGFKWSCWPKLACPAPRSSEEAVSGTDVFPDIVISTVFSWSKQSVFSRVCYLITSAGSIHLLPVGSIPDLIILIHVLWKHTGY